MVRRSGRVFISASLIDLVNATTANVSSWPCADIAPLRPGADERGGARDVGEAHVASHFVGFQPVPETARIAVSLVSRTRT